MMLSFILLSFLLFSSFVEASKLSSWECYELEGAKIVAEDGTFLGTLDDSYSSDSIYNSFSDYSSSYSSNSIWCDYCEYGNSYSSMSPFNDYASSPPVLLKDGKIVGILTIKPYEIDAVNPYSVGKDCGWDK